MERRTQGLAGEAAKCVTNSDAVRRTTNTQRRSRFVMPATVAEVVGVGVAAAAAAAAAGVMVAAVAVVEEVAAVVPSLLDALLNPRKAASAIKMVLMLH